MHRPNTIYTNLLHKCRLIVRAQKDGLFYWMNHYHRLWTHGLKFKNPLMIDLFLKNMPLFASRDVS